MALALLQGLLFFAGGLPVSERNLLLFPPEATAI